MPPRRRKSYPKHTKLRDGLYRVTYGDICAGFVIENDKVVMKAPILKNMSFWRYIAKRVVVVPRRK